ncbi:MAG: TolC family protein [Myxococcota bacterium]
MRARLRAVALILLMAPIPVVAAANLTFSDVVARVRRRAPEVLAAETALQSERAARVGATPLFGENPSVEGGAGWMAENQGTAWRDTRHGPTAWLQVSVPVEIAAQRWRRVAAADARILASAEARDETVREALLVAGMAFYRAVHAQQVVELQKRVEQLAERTRELAMARFRAGELAELEARLTEMESASASRDRYAAEAAYQHALAELATLLGVSLDEMDGVEGTLRRREPLPMLQQATDRAVARADVRVATAERKVALAEANEAAGRAFPTPRLKGYYQYWHQEHAVMAVVEVPLPLFEHGQGDEARARARARGMLVEEDQRREAARAEVRTAHALVTRLAGLRQQLEERGQQPLEVLLSDVETAYRSRQTDLNTLLNVLGHLLQAERELLDLQLQETLARLWLDAAMGALP